MNTPNILPRISFKYAAIITVVVLSMQIYQTITFNPQNVGSFEAILWGILTWCIFIVGIGLAHIEYNQKNEHFISFKEAIFIGLIMIGIYFAVNTLFSFLAQELFLNEKIWAHYQAEAEKAGESLYLRPTAGSLTEGLVIASLGSLVIQFILLFGIITYEAQWKIFKKAGRRGWKSFVPFYNVFIFLRICQKPTWWVVLWFIPFVNIVIVAMTYHGLSRAFGKTGSFTAGLFFLPFVFFPLLGLSRLQYQYGPATETGT
jgi:hypothetical protein